MGKIIIENLSKKYVWREKGKNKELEAVRDISMELKEDEFLVLFGPNGCGKTTILNIIAGLIDHDQGSVKMEGKAWNDIKVGYVFQQYQDSLFPWRRNIDNIAFPLELKGIPKRERLEKTMNFLRDFNIEIPECAYPYQLSGGQQRLLTITRALIGEPDVLLMDEPFDGLDYFTRISMQMKVLELWGKKKITTLFISHDIEEAIFMASRLIILTKRPARVFKTMMIDLPYPRNVEILQSPQFSDLRKEALNTIREVLEA